jgi:hypothetical protein
MLQFLALIIQYSSALLRSTPPLVQAGLEGFHGVDAEL